MTDQSTSPVEGAEALSPGVGDGETVIGNEEDFASFEESLDDQSEGVELEDQDVEGEQPEEPEPEAEDEDAEPQASVEEVEYEGQTYSVPTEIKDALLRNSDYTKKTQELAEQRKALEHSEEELTSLARMQNESMLEIGKLVSLSQQIAPFEQMDAAAWQAYAQQNPEAAQRDLVTFQAVKADRDQLIQSLQQKREAQDTERQNAHSKAIDAGRAELKTKIKGYDDQLESKLADFGSRFGFERGEILDAVSDPRSIEVLHLAMIGQEALTQRKQVKKHTQRQKTAPAKTLRGKGGQYEAAPDTSDFAAFERMADKRLG